VRFPRPAATTDLKLTKARVHAKTPASFDRAFETIDPRPERDRSNLPRRRALFETNTARLRLLLWRLGAKKNVHPRPIDRPSLERPR
jgi:hypothetical protein